MTITAQITITKVNHISVKLIFVNGIRLRFLRIQRYNRHRDAEVFASVTTSITYKDGLIITQQSEVEELDYDPSEGQDWIWEDFE